jgi:hypothetical protein
MSAWLPGGTAPLRTQMSAGPVLGDAAPTAGTSESNYMAGAITLMAQHPEAIIAPSSPTGTASFADQLIGRQAVALAASAGSVNPGGHAVNALNALAIHRNGLTL